MKYGNHETVNTPTSIPNCRAAFNSFCKEFERLGLINVLKKVQNVGCVVPAAVVVVVVGGIFDE